jgi:hypothetical protein
MIHRKTALPHHLLEISVRELVSAIPADTEENDRGLEVAPLERGFILYHEYDSEVEMAELRCGL